MPDRVLTREEIMSAVWTDRVVDEANLAQNIAVVRKALAAAPGTPAHIETFPGRGYRIEGPVISAVSETGPAGWPASNVYELASAGPQTASSSLALLRNPSTILAGFAALVVVALLAWISWSKIPEADTTYRVTPATRFSGKEFQPALSSDGKELAFVWTDGSKPPSVWIQSSQDSPPRQFSGSGIHGTSPAWSRDGTRLSYLQIGRDETQVIVKGVRDGAARVVARLSPPNYGSDYRLLDWSPDGRALVVSHAGMPGRPLTLFLIDTDSGTMQPLTASDETSSHVDPRFSPDGRTVTFIRFVHRFQQELFSIPVQGRVQGGGERQLTSSGKRISGHDWASDGRAIVFASDWGGEFRLWRLPVELSDGQGQSSSLGVYGEFPIQMAIARTAPTLAYASLQQDRNIWQLNLTDRS